jgi:alpha-galactosidase
MRAKVTARWADLGVSGKQAVRDLWQRKDLGAFTDSFAAEVPSHGSVLVKLSASR